MPRKSQKPERLLFRWIDVFVFSAASIFLLIIANIAWVLPILDEVELSGLLGVHQIVVYLSRIFNRFENSGFCDLVKYDSLGFRFIKIQ